MKNPLLPQLKASFPRQKTGFILVLLLLLGFAGGGVLYGQEKLVVNRDGETPNMPGNHGQDESQDADGEEGEGTETPGLPGNHGQDGNQDADESGTLQTQQLTMYAGWNWVSFYLDCDDELFAALQEGIAQNNTESLIKDMSQNVTLQNGMWAGSNLVFNNKTMYMILLDTNTTLTLNGLLADPAHCTINIASGWNWIGFPYNQSMPLGTALSGMQPHDGDVIKDMATSATYSGNAWEGSLTQMEPGKGYMYLNTGDVITLTFPSSK